MVLLKKHYFILLPCYRDKVNYDAVIPVKRYAFISLEMSCCFCLYASGLFFKSIGYPVQKIIKHIPGCLVMDILQEVFIGKQLKLRRKILIGFPKRNYYAQILRMLSVSSVPEHGDPYGNIAFSVFFAAQAQTDTLKQFGSFIELLLVPGKHALSGVILFCRLHIRELMQKGVSPDGQAFSCESHRMS